MTWIKSKFFLSAATWSLITCCAVLPISTGLLSLFSISTLLFWLLSGEIKKIPTLIKTNSVVSLSLLLFFLFTVGLAYSSATIDDSLSYLKKYRELLFIPIVISILQDKPLSKKKCEYGFLIGCIVLLLLSYGMYFSFLPSAKIGYSTIYHITHSFFISILAFYSVHKFFDSANKYFKYLWVVIFILSVINIFYIAPGRTGMLVFIFLMSLLFIQRLSILKQVICFFLLILMMSITYITSDNLQTRSKQAIEEIQSYKHGASRTSLGMRFDWWYSSIQLIKEKPLFGYGTGSFTTEHGKLINGSQMRKTDNPHNEFLLIGVQLGMVGLFLFILIFIAQYRCSFKLKKPDRQYLQGVATAMLVGCIMNSFLFDSHQGHFWAILSAVHLSAIPRGNSLLNK